MEHENSHIQGYPNFRDDAHPGVDAQCSPRALDEPWASGQRKRYLASLLEAQESA